MSAIITAQSAAARLFHLNQLDTTSNMHFRHRSTPAIIHLQAADVK